jgi:16S rRNA C967 or C1407 C5-methylase (RsmB/RsmF family)/NOL1/NOP2/fmu family ribosome biogenesis protein
MNLPEAFVNRLKTQFPDQWELMIPAYDREIQTSVLKHPKKFKHTSIVGETVLWNSLGLLLKERPKFTFDPHYHAGAYYSQEANSMLIGHLFQQAIQEIENPAVLDLCAAPGGKSLIYATLLGEKGVLVSNEVMPQRLSILRENLDKWGIPNVFTLGMYPNKIPFTHCFDVVAVDAPCSGEGLFRKQIDYRGEWKESFAHTCAVRQHEILQEAFRLLKPGGYLLYSTCTFAPEENEEIISYLTEEFQLENISVEMKKEWNVDVVKGTFGEGYRMLPHNTPGEGFFCALMKKPERNTEKIRFKSNMKIVPLNAKERSTVNAFIREDVALVKNEKGLVFLDTLQHTFKEIWRALLPNANAGTLVGEFMKDKFIPGQGIANTGIECTEVRKLELSYDDVIRYLKKEVIQVEAEAGFVIVTFEHQNIGWGKVVGTRLNNNYPNEWRIRF